MDLNPYEPPKAQLPAVCYAHVPVNRGPLIAVETEAERFLVENSALELLSNAAYIQLVLPILEHPKCIFGDLKRHAQDGSVCYCRSPGECLDDDKIYIPPTACVALAFAKFDQRSKSIVVTRLDFRLEDRAEPGHPVNWESDFGDRLWKR